MHIVTGCLVALLIFPLGSAAQTSDLDPEQADGRAMIQAIAKDNAEDVRAVLKRGNVAANGFYFDTSGQRIAFLGRALYYNRFQVAATLIDLGATELEPGTCGKKDEIARDFAGLIMGSSGNAPADLDQRNIVLTKMIERRIGDLATNQFLYLGASRRGALLPDLPACQYRRPVAFSAIPIWSRKESGRLTVTLPDSGIAQMRLLKKIGVDYHAVDSYGASVAHIFASTGWNSDVFSTKEFSRVLMILKELGVDVGQPDSAGFRPVDFVRLSYEQGQGYCAPTSTTITEQAKAEREKAFLDAGSPAPRAPPGRCPPSVPFCIRC